MSEDKQCLQRDTIEGRCLEEGCGKNMLDDCLFPRRMRSALQWSRLETNVSIQPTCCYTVTFATRSVLHRSDVPAKFLLGTSTRCLQNVRHQTRWLWYGLGTKHTMDHGR